MRIWETATFDVFFVGTLHITLFPVSGRKDTRFSHTHTCFVNRYVTQNLHNRPYNITLNLRLNCKITYCLDSAQQWLPHCSNLGIHRSNGAIWQNNKQFKGVQALFPHTIKMARESARPPMLHWSFRCFYCKNVVASQENGPAMCVHLLSPMIFHVKRPVGGRVKVHSNRLFLSCVFSLSRSFSHIHTGTLTRTHAQTNKCTAARM